jgi:transposase
LVPDETGWHVGGMGAWLHALVSAEATAYVIDPTRSGAVAESLLGADYTPVMIHDGCTATLRASWRACLESP